MNQRIVLATGNAGKAKEFAEMLGGQFDIVLQTTLRLAAAEETGCTFLENALLKARFAALQSGLPAIADDSGLEVGAVYEKDGFLKITLGNVPNPAGVSGTGVVGSVTVLTP